MPKKLSSTKTFGFGNTNRRFPQSGKRTQGKIAKDHFAFDQAMQGHDCTKISRNGDFIVQKRDFFGETEGEPQVVEVKTGLSKLTEAQEQRKKTLGRKRYRIARY